MKEQYKHGETGAHPVFPHKEKLVPRAFSLERREGDKDAPLRATICRYSDTVTFSVPMQAALGCTSGVMRLFCDDNGAVLWLPLSLERTENGLQYWSLTTSGAQICAGGERSGLFYFRFEFETRYGHLIYAKAPNDLFPVYRWEDFDIHAFQWTVTTDDKREPGGFAGGIMYHIFVDRFARGEGIDHPPIPRRDDAEYNEDWYNGIPQHAKRPGGFVKNNEFFGGNLWGILEKLPYLASLGVTVLYLSPIFTAYSNHKYDTGDYASVDASFGGDAAFAALLDGCKAHGISVICDGVFNHTGDNSRYFNRYGTYPEVGAYQSKDSPYYPWYRFRSYPDDYDSWWGVKVLPGLYSGNADFRRYICGDDCIIHKWMALGVSGWRLDVADELDDRFLCDLYRRVKLENPDGIVYGEVWEDASNKIAYDRRRRYFRGEQLDSVMNYPFRDGILSFIKHGDAERLSRTLKTILAHYPKSAVDRLMNLLGTHDTERIITALAAPPCGELDNDALALLSMTEQEKARGVALVRLASVLQFTLPGIPCIYYGDEVGMEGYRDPFNRRPFPWGREDETLLSHYRHLAKIRSENAVFADGETRVLYAGDGVFDFVRYTADGKRLRICVNRGKGVYPIAGAYKDLLSDTEHRGAVYVPVDGAVILKDNI